MEENLKQMLDERKNLEEEGRKLAEELTEYTSGKMEADLDSKLESRLKAISEKLEADLEAITETYNENMTTDYTKAGRQRAEVENLKNEYRKNAEEEIKKVRAEIEEQREAIKSKIDEQNKKINDQNEKIDAQNRKIGLELRKMRDALLPEIAVLQKELAENNAQVEIAQKEYDEAYAKYNAEKMSLYRNGVFTEPDSSKMDEAKAKLDELTASGKSVEAKLSEKQGRVDNISQFFGTIMVKETSVEDIQKMIFGEEQSKVETAKTEEEIKQEFIDKVKQRNHAAAQKADENRKDIEEEKSEATYTKSIMTNDDLDYIARNTFEMLTEEQKQELADQLSKDITIEQILDDRNKFKEDYGKFFAGLDDFYLASLQNKLQEICKEEIEKAKNVKPENPASQQPANPVSQQPANPVSQQPASPASQQPANSAPQKQSPQQQVNPRPQKPTNTRSIKDVIKNTRIAAIELDLSTGQFNISFNDGKIYNIEFDEASNLNNFKIDSSYLLKEVGLKYNKKMDPFMIKAICNIAQKYLYSEGIKIEGNSSYYNEFIRKCVEQYDSSINAKDTNKDNEKLFEEGYMKVTYTKSAPDYAVEENKGNLGNAIMPYLRRVKKSPCVDIDENIDTRTLLQKFTDNVKNIFGNKVKALGDGKTKTENTQQQENTSLSPEEAARQQAEEKAKENEARQIKVFGPDMVKKTIETQMTAMKNKNSARDVANANINREEAKVQEAKDKGDR